MKITVQTQREVDITFPAYFTHGNSFYKITSESKGIAASTEKGEESLEIVHYESVIGIVVMNGKKTTEAAFNDAYNATLTYFSSLNTTP